MLSLRKAALASLVADAVAVASSCLVLSSVLAMGCRREQVLEGESSSREMAEGEPALGDLGDVVMQGQRPAVCIGKVLGKFSWKQVLSCLSPGFRALLLTSCPEAECWRYPVLPTQ